MNRFLIFNFYRFPGLIPIIMDGEGYRMNKRLRFNKVPDFPKKFRPRIRIHRMFWEFHQYDDDPFPSVPHGHSIEPRNRYKLDINTGEIYEKGQIVGLAEKKELDELKNDNRFKKFVAKAIEYHNDKSSSKLPFRRRRFRRSSAIYVGIMCKLN